MNIDPKPILDEGNPISTAGIMEIIDLFGVLQMSIVSKETNKNYKSGWGSYGSD